MVELLSITLSEKPDKKLKAVFQQDSGRTKTIHFGAKKDGVPMDDYTITHDKEQRSRYLNRHKKEDWNNPVSAAALSRHILWGNSTSINKNIKSYIKLFNF